MGKIAEARTGQEEKSSSPSKTGQIDMGLPIMKVLSEKRPLFFPID